MITHKVLPFYTANNTGCLFTAGADKVYIEFQLLSLGIERALISAGGTVIYLLADGGLRIYRNTGSQGAGSTSVITVSGPELAAQGITLNTTDIFGMFFYISHNNSATVYLFQGEKGIKVFFPTLTYDSHPFINSHVPGMGITSAGGPNSWVFTWVVKTDFVLVRAITIPFVSAPGTSESLYFSICATLYNKGFGRSLKSVIATARTDISLSLTNFDKSGPEGAAVGKMPHINTVGVQFYPAFSYEEYKNNFDPICGVRIGNKIINLPGPKARLKELKNYIYEGSTGNLTSRSFEGPILPADGSGNLPTTLKNLYLDNNPLYGVSNIVDSYLSSLFLRSFSIPAGKTGLEIYIQNQKNGMEQVLFRRGYGLVKFNLNTASPTPLKIANFEMWECGVTGDATQIINFNKFFFDALTMQGVGITGQVPALLEGTKSVNFSTSRLSGPHPALPSTITGYNIADNYNVTGPVPEMPVAFVGGFYGYRNKFTAVPSTFKNIAVLSLWGNELEGVVVATKATVIELSTQNSSNIAELQAGVGTLSVDLSAQEVNMGTGYFNGEKIGEIKLPTTLGRTITNFSMGYRSTVRPVPVVFPTWGMFIPAGMFIANNGKADRAWPIGSAILSNNIFLEGNGMSEANTNETIDNWVAGHTAGAGGASLFSSAATLKTLLLSGDNAAPTNAGRTTRLDEIAATIELGNWLYKSGAIITSDYTQMYLRIMNVFDGSAGGVDRVVFEVPYNNTVYNARNYTTITISNTEGVYDGVWTVASQTNSLALAQTSANRSDTYGQFWVLTKAGATFAGNKTGTIKATK